MPSDKQWPVTNNGNLQTIVISEWQTMDNSRKWQTTDNGKQQTRKDGIQWMMADNCDI